MSLKDSSQRKIKGCVRKVTFFHCDPTNNTVFGFVRRRWRIWVERRGEKKAKKDKINGKLGINEWRRRRRRSRAPGPAEIDVVWRWPGITPVPFLNLLAVSESHGPVEWAQLFTQSEAQSPIFVEQEGKREEKRVTDWQTSFHSKKKKKNPGVDFLLLHKHRVICLLIYTVINLLTQW